MSAPSATPVGTRDHDRAGAQQLTSHANHRQATETKAAFKTTEFMAYVAVLAGILIAGLVVDDGAGGQFGAEKVWLFSTILTVGYMVSRGLAKAGSREPYTADNR